MKTYKVTNPDGSYHKIEADFISIGDPLEKFSTTRNTSQGTCVVLTKKNYIANENGSQPAIDYDIVAVLSIANIRSVVEIEP